MAESDSKPYGIIYCITNKVNGKRYIGQTTMSLLRRWRAHCHAIGRCKAISAAIQKYGPESFVIVEIDRAYSRAELDAKEKAHIETANTLNPKFGYNLRPGGLSATFSEETRAVMSAKKKGRKLTEEHKAKIAASSAGVPKTAEHSAKVSAAKKGVRHSAQHRANMCKPRPDFVMSEEHKKAIRAVATGAVFTEERRAKISLALKGKKKGPLSEETKAKLSLVNKGTTRTPEQRQRMSEGRKAAQAARLLATPI